MASTRDECLSPRVRLECNPEIPVAPGEEHWLLDTSLDEVYWPCIHSRGKIYMSGLVWKKRRLNRKPLPEDGRLAASWLGYRPAARSRSLPGPPAWP